MRFTRHMKRSSMMLAVVGLAGLAATACTDPTAAADQTTLLAVSPEGGATGVPIDAPIVVEFSHAMQMDMEKYAAVHEGTDISGDIVEGMWDWSHDRMTLTFTPSAPLTPQASYTIHIGGGMSDGHGNPVDVVQHGGDMGGHDVTQQMMDDRMMMGGVMGDMMGAGWEHPTDGTYGMVFTFTTG